MAIALYLQYVKLANAIKDVLQTNGNIIFLTGAGLSAESGIPTFRGKEGYWSIGSKNYMPTEMATQAMFLKHPSMIWEWYLYRFGVCASAAPNPGHLYLAKLEKLLGNRFVLVSQNIDGLHQKAGNSQEKSFYIHGNSAYMRCANSCTKALSILPEALWFSKKQSLQEWHKLQLSCQCCGAWMRPHVLWFDEQYDEEYYRFDSVLEKAAHADLVFLIGTSGSTTLPSYLVQLAIQTGAYLIEINPNETNYSDIVASFAKGKIIRKSAKDALNDVFTSFKKLL